VHYDLDFSKFVTKVYVVATHELCRERNSIRVGSHRYTPETYVLDSFLDSFQLTICTSLENLLVRYEEPSSMVRWDSPLFTTLWTEEYPPVYQIWEAVTKGNVKPPNSGTLAVGTELCSFKRMVAIMIFSDCKSTH
jgi:protein KTI12